MTAAITTISMDQQHLASSTEGPVTGSKALIPIIFGAIITSFFRSYTEEIATNMWVFYKDRHQNVNMPKRELSHYTHGACSITTDYGA
jgi:hypothetical protein